MIINVFKNENEDNIPKLYTENNNINNLNFKEIQDELIKNHIDLLKNERKEELINKIEEYLIKNYGAIEDKKRDNICNLLINKMFGYDILQKYIDDIEITDIRVVKYDEIYIKRNGKWEKTLDTFNNDNDFNRYIRYCVQKNNSNINYDIPIVVVSDKKYKLRIEAGISPVNSISSNIVIRIHRNNIDISLEKLFIKDNMLDSKSYRIICELIYNYKNIIISGKGGSGKTTLLRAILQKIPKENSITINEETTELFMNNRNVIQREILENRIENKKINLQSLMKNSLVMSNDVIVVGELKGKETSSFIDSISTGHMGIATIHSNSANLTIDRLVLLFKRDELNQQYSESFVRQILSSSIDYIIYIKDYVVKEILKVEYSYERNNMDLNKIY